MSDPGEDEWLDDKGALRRTCWQCGGEGFLEGTCTCMEDCCCCLDNENVPYVDCYREDETPARKKMIEAANKRLATPFS